MQKITFFTPVVYTTPSNLLGSSLLEKVDNYFYLGGKKAHVIQGRTKNGQEKAVLSEGNSSFLARVVKVLSYFTIVTPLFMLIAKAVLRSTHSFKLIDPKQKLEKGISVSDHTVAKVQGLISKILRGEDDGELEWLSKGNNLVFKLTQRPHFVFKIVKPSLYLSETRALTRFENMVKAKEVCMVNELGLLIIPRAKKLTVNAGGKNHVFIVEESLDFASNESAQEKFYHKYSTELNQTARQLATFIAKTGFNDVTWRNIPILKEEQEFQGPRRIGLIDLEDMKSAVNGFIGDLNGSCGLIGCVSEAQINIVIAEARQQGVAIPGEEALRAKNRRLQELESDKALRAFHNKKNVITGQELIEVDLDSLDLDLTKEGQIERWVVEEDKCEERKETVTLRKVTEDVIAEINRRIQNSPRQASTKGKRQFFLSTSAGLFNAYNRLGLPPGYTYEEEEGKQLWIHCIITALVDKGHIFKLDKINGSYFIQA